MDNTLSQWVIFSEIVLSLYPQLIKLIPATLDIQIAIRFITYSILALVSIPSFQTLQTITNIAINNTLFMSLVMGLVNILHIASSYYSFSVLSSGFSYTLFYTYPIFNLLGRYLFNNEYIQPGNYLFITIAILGVYLIYNQSSRTDNTDNPDNTKKTIEIRLGLIAGICSAITESIIYLMVKNDIPTVSPFIQIIKTYLLGGIISIGYIVYRFLQTKDNDKDNILDTPEWEHLSSTDWITLILFNALVGFMGYVLRFYLIPKTSTIIFNSLIFTGVIFAYIWGYILGGEKIYITNILGTLLIISSIYMINKKN